MTYGVQRMTFTGNTLCDKLKAEFGERTAVSLDLGREANARRAARTASPARRNAKRSVNEAVAKNPPARNRGHMSTPREFAAARNTEVVHRPASRTGAQPHAPQAPARANGQRRPNIMRDTVVHKMEKPHTDKTPLEVSVATFGAAYRRGEKVREYAAAERSKPHARTRTSAKAEKKSALVSFLTAMRKYFVGEKVRAEVRVKKTPFPFAAIALIGVCSIMVAVMISSFAQLNEYRAEISALETRQSQLRGEETRLNGLVEAKEDIRAVEQTATEEMGMVSADLAQSRFVSLSSEDRVEVKNTASEEEAGAFSVLLSAIGENLGALSEYFN